MENRTILNFFIPFAVISSVFCGQVYNFLLFYQATTLESHWSIFTTDFTFANLMAITFILFALTFLISFYFQKKVAKESMIIAAIILIGFSCIYASLIWTWEVVILVFLLTAIATAYLIPVFARLISDKISREKLNQRSALILPVSALIWILISLVLFRFFGASSWRMLYFITGVINISSSFLIFMI
ncbi:MAG: hypothetical protein ACFE9Q_06430 [Candidatus Hodarchaeota archaeon]